MQPQRHKEVLESFQSHSPAGAAAYGGRGPRTEEWACPVPGNGAGWSLSCIEWRWRNDASTVGWEVTFVPFSL